MKKTILFIIISLLNVPAFALDYNDFPPALQQVLKQRIAELDPNVVCVAGIVTMSDEAQIGSGKDVKVNYFKSVDEPLWVYKDGWFVMGRVVQPGSYPGPAKLIVKAFGYEPIEASIAVNKGQITYEEFVLNKTPAEKLASVEGTVFNDQNQPFNGACVSLSFPYSSHGMGNEPFKTVTTGPDGKYFFKGLSRAEHYLTASAEGYAYHHITITPTAGQTETKNLKLYQNRKITIDYVYQEDGSRNFTGGSIKTGTIEWTNGNEGMDFAEGKTANHQHRDLEMSQDQDKLIFRIFYVNGENGFYDAGDVDFESVKEAAEKGYSTNPKQCEIGHTYVVRTYENKYAKFVVVDIFGNK